MWVAPAQAQCRLCLAEPGAVMPSAARPLSIEVETSLDFSRAASSGGGGSIDLDATSGARRVAGLIDLGGIALGGRVTLTGEPMRSVRISLPATIRLTAPNGARADVVDLTSDAGADPVLDATGRLSFTFGGRLIVEPGMVGELRGRIPITADYR